MYRLLADMMIVRTRCRHLLSPMLAAISCLWFAACSAPAPVERATTAGSSAHTPTVDESEPEVALHVVEKGETVYSIARDYGVSPDAVMRANQLSSPPSVQRGCVLIIPLSPSALERYCSKAETTPAPRVEEKPGAPGPSKGFIWPASGEIVLRFGQPQLVNGVPDRNMGVNIRVSRGEKILATRAGVVAFVSDSFPGWGKVVIIDHGSGLFSFYAYNSSILTKAGQRVEQGDAIALGGKSGRAKIPQLHFRIIRDGNPVDPLRYLISNQ